MQSRTCRTPALWTPAAPHGAEGFGGDRGQMEGGREGLEVRFIFLPRRGCEQVQHLSSAQLAALPLPQENFSAPPTVSAKFDSSPSRLRSMRRRRVGLELLRFPRQDGEDQEPRGASTELLLLAPLSFMSIENFNYLATF